jgi:dihydrofolate synthase/folylpolyglutamate synthase
MKSQDKEYLYSLTNEYRSLRYDLGNIRILSGALADPHSGFRSVLIAGTNGKGSVARWLAAMVPGSGLYTSPHLIDLNERISIGGVPVEEDDLEVLFQTVRSAAREVESRLMYPPTYFELVTAMAFRYFERRVRFAVLEVGLGGRLDATNLVQQDASVITNIGLDHQEHLGATLGEIAAEKAGIIKGTEPVIVGPDSGYDCIRDRANGRLIDAKSIESELVELGGGYFEVSLRTPVRTYSRLRPQLAGRHQIDNLVVAVRTAECLEELGWPIDAAGITEAVNTVTWPGRLEHLGGSPSFLLDGGHNIPAVRALDCFLREYHPEGVWIVFGGMREKDCVGMIEALRPHATTMVLTRPSSSRAMDPDDLSVLVPGSVVRQRVEDAIEYAKDQAPADATVLVTGSLYLVGEARAFLRPTR